MRLIVFSIFCVLVFWKSCKTNPAYLMMLLLFMYFFYPEKYIWGIEEYRIVLLLNVALLIAVLIRYKTLSIYNDRYSVLMILLAGSFFLSAIYATMDSRIAMDGAMQFIKAVVFWILLKNILAKDIRNVDLFLWACMVSLSLLALWGVQQYYLGNTRLEDFGGPQIEGSNQLASAFIWGLPIAYYKAFGEAGWKRYVCFGCLIILLMGIIFTESRQAFLALVFYGVCFFVVTRKKMFYVTATLVAALTVLPFVPSSYWDRMGSIGEYSQDGSASGRLEMWSAAGEIFADNPVLGVGPDNFILIARYYVGLGQHVRVTHNTIMQILSEQGVLGISILCILIFYTLRGLWRLSREKAEHALQSDPLSYYSLAMLMSLAGVLVCSMFQNKADHEFLYWPAAVAAALESMRQRISEKTIDQHEEVLQLNG